MSVLIKDMDMPTNCRECHFDVAGWCYATGRIDNRTSFVTDYLIQPWCPLSPGPPYGKWVNYGDEYCPDIRCYVCGQRKPILLGNFNFNYCPNCGAKMDLEE